MTTPWDKVKAMYALAEKMKGDMEHQDTGSLRRAVSELLPAGPERTKALGRATAIGTAPGDLVDALRKAADQVLRGAPGMAFALVEAGMRLPTRGERNDLMAEFGHVIERLDTAEKNLCAAQGRIAGLQREAGHAQVWRRAQANRADKTEATLGAMTLPGGLFPRVDALEGCCNALDDQVREDRTRTEQTREFAHTLNTKQQAIQTDRRGLAASIHSAHERITDATIRASTDRRGLAKSTRAAHIRISDVLGALEKMQAQVDGVDKVGTDTANSMRDLGFKLGDTINALAALKDLVGARPCGACLGTGRTSAGQGVCAKCAGTGRQKGTA